MHPNPWHGSTGFEVSQCMVKNQESGCIIVHYQEYATPFKAALPSGFNEMSLLQHHLHSHTIDHTMHVSIIYSTDHTSWLGLLNSANKIHQLWLLISNMLIISDDTE